MDWKRSIFNVGLEDGSHQTPQQPPTADEWLTLLAWVGKQRVLGLLWQLANEVGFPPAMLDEPAPLWRTASRRTLALEGSIPSVVDALAAPIDWRVLKGVATSRLPYSDYGLRTFGDIDILVRPAGVDRTLEALQPITPLAPPRCTVRIVRWRCRSAR